MLSCFFFSFDVPANQQADDEYCCNLRRSYFFFQKSRHLYQLKTMFIGTVVAKELLMTHEQRNGLGSCNAICKGSAHACMQHASSFSSQRKARLSSAILLRLALCHACTSTVIMLHGPLQKEERYRPKGNGQKCGDETKELLHSSRNGTD